MSVVGGLPGAPAVAGTVPVASTQAARDGGLALVLGPAGDGGALSLWDPADRATPLSVDFLAGRQGYRLETTGGSGFSSPGHFPALEGCNDYQMFWD